jgi:hypothetical protein
MSVGDAVATNLDILGDGTGSENGPVPAVDPADLRRVWAVQNDLQALAPEEQFEMGFDLYKRACSPGADVRAVFARVSALRKLKLMSASGGLISAWLHHGEPDDAVFRVVATFSMIRMQPGVRGEGLPLDVEGLVRQIRKEARAYCTTDLSH